MKFNSERLDELQRTHCTTNYKLAKEIGVHQTTVKNWKNGVSPRLEHVGRVCKYFGVPQSDLLTD